jgi:uncharacterized protein YjiK
MFMRLSSRLGRFGLLLGLVLLVAVASILNWSGTARAWFALNQWLSPSESALGLARYQATVEARHIEGLSGDVSALTFDPNRNTLFTVTNKTPELVELSLEGEVVRRIPLAGFDDPEAVEYVAPNTYVISDERQQRLVQVEVTDATQVVNAVDGNQLALGLGLNGNKGFEGLAYDSVGQRLFVAKERDPVRIYEISGFPLQGKGAPLAIEVREDAARDRALFVRDLSSLQFDTGTGHLLVVSDESGVIVELDADGKPVGSLSLVAGAAGLKNNVPQAEGIAMDAAGALYIVSEPNLLYKFEPRPAE